jgi:hypothetical protein
MSTISKTNNKAKKTNKTTNKAPVRGQRKRATPQQTARSKSNLPPRPVQTLRTMVSSGRLAPQSVGVQMRSGTKQIGRLVMGTEIQEASVAESQITAKRVLELHTQHDGSLVIKFNVPLTEIISSNNTDQFGAALHNVQYNGTTGQFSGSQLLSPVSQLGLQYTSGSYDEWTVLPQSPQLALQALAFSKYSMLDLGFTYCPTGQTYQSTAIATAESRLRFCYTEDPMHPVLGFNGYFNNITGYDVLAETTNSVQFSEWNSWHLRVPVDSSTKYTYSITRAGGTTANDWRLSHFGVISCYDSYENASDRIQMTHGMLWMNGTIRLSDPSPLLVRTALPAITLLNEAYCHRETVKLTYDRESKGESKEEKKEDDSDDGEYNLPTTRWTPNPSSSPGAPTYVPATPKKKSSGK